MKNFLLLSIFLLGSFIFIDKAYASVQQLDQSSYTNDLVPGLAHYQSLGNGLTGWYSGGEMKLGYEFGVGQLVRLYILECTTNAISTGVGFPGCNVSGSAYTIYDDVLTGTATSTISGVDTIRQFDPDMYYFIAIWSGAGSGSGHLFGTTSNLYANGTAGKYTGATPSFSPISDFYFKIYTLGDGTNNSQITSLVGEGTEVLEDILVTIGNEWPLDLTVTQFDVDFTVQYYFNSTNDFGRYDQVCVEFQSLEGFYAVIPFCSDIDTSGFDSFSDTVNNLPYGYSTAIMYFYNSVTGVKEKVKSFDFINRYTFTNFTPHPDAITGTGLYGTLYGTTTASATSSLGVIENCDAISQDDNAVVRTLNKVGCVIVNGFKAILQYLFVPSAADVQNTISVVHDRVLTRFPIGYLTRLYDIAATTTATTSLPLLSVDFKDSSPLGAINFSYNFNTVMDEASDLLNNDLTSGRGIIDVDNDYSVWEIFMDIINLVMWIGFMYVILQDFLGFYRDKSVDKYV